MKCNEKSFYDCFLDECEIHLIGDRIAENADRITSRLRLINRQLKGIIKEMDELEFSWGSGDLDKFRNLSDNYIQFKHEKFLIKRIL